MSALHCFGNGIFILKKAYKGDFVVPILHMRFPERIKERSDQGRRQEQLGSLGTQSFVKVVVQRAVEFVLYISGVGREQEGDGGLRDTTGDFPNCACCCGLPFPVFPLLHKIIWMVTFISAIFLGLDVGLLVSIAFAFFVITVRSHRYFVSGDRRLAVAR